MNKKTKLAILGVFGLVLVTLSLTYAYWLITRTQTKENIITAGCLDISLTNEQNDISLTEQFPISDDEGKELTPYTFTVTNNCSTAVDYNVNLEVLGDKETNIQTSSIKAMLDEEAPTLLGLNYEEESSAGAYVSYRIGFGTLTSKGTATHSVRLWIDEEASISEMNKTFSSKVSVTAGQGINNPLKEGTLAYDLVSQYNKDNATILNSKWYEEIGELRNNISVQENRVHKWSNTYIFDETNGGYTLSGDVVEATIGECRSKIKICGKYLKPAGSGLTYLVESLTSDRVYSGTGYTYITARRKLSNNAFTKGSQEDTATIHKAPDDYGISYYLRGDVTNNYVEFGTYADETTIISGDNDLNDITEEVPAGAKMYWRIVRINGDGTIRMIYDGITKKENGAEGVSDIGKTMYNSIEDEAKHIGYTYLDNDEQVDSTIKDFVDTWYEDNLKVKYEKYIADRIFCNDREFATDEYFYSGIDNRLQHNASPKLTCKQSEDRYTVDIKNGNGYLSNPVGLVTADEAMFAGLSNYNFVTSYLARNGESWTLTPEIATSGLLMFVFGYSGYVDAFNNLAIDTVTARPVINLKADVKFTGNGSYETPYVITID